MQLFRCLGMALATRYSVENSNLAHRYMHEVNSFLLAFLDKCQFLLYHFVPILEAVVKHYNDIWRDFTSSTIHKQTLCFKGVILSFLYAWITPEYAHSLLDEDLYKV